MRPGAVDTDDRPFVLIYELTQACDLTCDHCRADAQPNRHPEELSTAEAKALLEDVREFGDNQLVVLSGGDPLKRDDAVEVVEYGTDLGLRVTMTPSGTASLTESKIEALADAGLGRMAVSIDGATATAHDRFRGVDGSFDETLRAAEQARAAGIPIQVNTTVCAATVDDLPGIRDLVEEMGAVFWSVFFLVPVGRGRVLDPIGPERADEIMAWLHEVGDEAPFGVKTTEAPQYRRVVLQQTVEGEGNTPDRDEGATAQNAGGDVGAKPKDDKNSGPPPGVGNGNTPARRGRSNGSSSGARRRSGIVAGDGFAFVSHTGEVYPSGFLPESAGNVRDQSIVDIYRNADLFESLRDRENLTGKCGACPYRHVCGGSRSRAYATTGNPLASDPLCPYVPPGYDGPLPWESSSTGRPIDSDMGH